MFKTNIPGAYAKSGGPQTAAGKSVFARNALQLGAYPTSYLLPSENAQEHRDFEDALLEDLQPDKHLMHTMAQSIVGIIWRMRRLERYESSVMQAEYDQPFDRSEVIRSLGANWESIFSSVERMTDQMLDKDIGFYEKFLAKVQEVERFFPTAPTDLDNFRAQYSEACALLKHLHGKEKDFDAAVMDTSNPQKQLELWKTPLANALKWASRCVQDFHAVAQYERVITKLRNQRIFRFLVEDTASCPRNDFQRALQRAMAEYHRERDRFRKERAVLLDREPPSDGDQTEASGERTQILEVEAAS